MQKISLSNYVEISQNNTGNTAQLPETPLTDDIKGGEVSVVIIQ